MWCYAHGADEQEAHAPSETDALADVELPYELGEGGADQGEGLEEYAYEEGGAGAEDAGGCCCDGRDEQGHGYGEAAYKCEVEGCGAGEDVIGEVVGKEHTVRLFICLSA